MTEPSARVNALGLECPLPVFHARDALFDLRAGERLEVLADDPQAPSDFETWCPRNGHKLLVIRPEGRAFRILIEKGAEGGAADPGGPAARAGRAQEATGQPSGASSHAHPGHLA